MKSIVVYITVFVLFSISFMYLVVDKDQKEDKFTYDIELISTLESYEKYAHLHISDYKDLPESVTSRIEHYQSAEFLSLLDSLVEQGYHTFGTDLINIEKMNKSCSSLDVIDCFDSVFYFHYSHSKKRHLVEKIVYNKTEEQITEEIYQQYNNLFTEWLDLTERYKEQFEISTSPFVIYENHIVYITQEKDEVLSFYENQNMSKLIKATYELEAAIIHLELFLEHYNTNRSFKAMNFQKEYNKLVNSIPEETIELFFSNKTCKCAQELYKEVIQGHYNRAVFAYNKSLFGAAFYNMLMVKGYLESAELLSEITWPMSYPRSQVPSHIVDIEFCLRKRSDFYLYYALLHNSGNNDEFTLMKQRVLDKQVGVDIRHNGEKILYEASQDPSFHDIGIPLSCANYINMAEFSKFLYYYTLGDNELIFLILFI